MSQSERNLRICGAVIACWRRCNERQTIGRRRLYDAVNELWAEMLLQEYTTEDQRLAEWRQLSRA